MSLVRDKLRRITLFLLAFACSASAATYTPIAQIMTPLPDSNLLGQTVTIRGGVIVAFPNGVVYVHALAEDELSSGTNAMPIYGNTAGCTQANDQMEATGVVKNLPASTPAHTSAVALEVTSCTVTGTTSFVTDAGSVPSFSTFQDGMKLTGSTFSFYSIRDVSPSGGTWDDATATVTPDGMFYGVPNGPAQRVFRLPGIPPNENVPVEAPLSVLHSAGHPELTLTDHKTLGAILTSYTVGQNLVCNPVAGAPADAPHLEDHVLMDWTEGVRRLLWFPYVSCDDTSGYKGPLTIAPPQTDGQVHIGTLDLFRFYDDRNDIAGVPVVTSAGYARRRTKAAMAIVDVFSMPEIMVVNEVKDLAVMQDLSTSVDARAVFESKTPPGYAWYSAPGAQLQSLQNGLLVKTSAVDVISTDNPQQNATYTTPSGATAPLWESPPIVLHAAVHRDRAPYLLTVIGVRFAERDHIDDPVLGPDVRAQRGAQVQALAALVQSFQSAGERVVVAGNFNANEFNDGFVDVVNAVRGAPAASASVTLSTPTDVHPVLSDLTSGTPSDQRYNIFVDGIAQSFEHILITSNLQGSVVQTHFTADYARENANLDTTPAGLTPHDGQAAILAVPAAKADLSADTSLSFGNVVVGTQSATLPVNMQAATPNDATVDIQSAVITGPNAPEFHIVTACNTSAPPVSLTPGQKCSTNVWFAPTEIGPRTATLTITSDATNTPMISIALSGNGIPPLSATPSPVEFGNVDVTSVSTAQTVTVKNNGAQAVALTSIAVSAGYQMTSACGTSIPAGGTCAMSVRFAPLTTGQNAGSLNVDTNQAGYALSVPLHGNGVDFAVSVSPDHGAVIAGLDISTVTTLAGIAGYSGQLTLSCTTDAVASICDLPESVHLTSSTSLKTVIHTTAKYTVIGYGGLGNRWYLALLAFGCGFWILRARQRSNIAKGLLSLAILLCATCAMTGCSGRLPDLNTPYTGPGEYHYTISATDGILTHSATYTLKVLAKK